MILKLIIAINILIIMYSLLAKRYLDSVKNEEVVQTYEKVGCLSTVYQSIKIGIKLAIANGLLSFIILTTINNKFLYIANLIWFLLIIFYFVDNGLNINSVRNGIKQHYIIKKKREEANKDMEERFKKEKFRHLS